ncbi:MAG: phosphotransferase, partial [Acidobacteria bacterium]|nr:phosphotransferase [Acidobacteriota bacterium]
MDEEPPQIPLESQVQAWLGTFGRRFTSLRRLSGDVSPRRYCRLVLESGEPAILAVYPPEMADTYGRFLVTGALLTQVQVPVPEVLETDKAQRFMLLEDLGTRSLFELELPSWGERKPFFELAMDLAARIRELDPERIAPLNPPLDAGTLEKELEQTWRTYLHPQGMARGELGSELEGALAELCRTLAELPPEPCHRDFMARNLMPRPGELYAGNGAADPSLVVLDHQ